MMTLAKFKEMGFCKLPFGKLGLLLAAAMLLSVFTFAQASDAQPQNTSAAAASTAPSKDSPEASGEDETTPFKHSGSVKLLSRVTGLSVDGAYWLAVILNFAIVAGVVIWFSKKNLPARFSNRTATIQKALAEARAASEDANRRLAEIESRLGRLGEEIGQMQKTAETSAAAEEERIKASAEEDGRRIIETAQQEIAAAGRAARRELTAHAADLAVTLASQQIRVDAPTDQALVRRFAKDLASSGVPGKKV